ncbi:MAG: ATP-binding protein [Elusimicrobiota bacterium]
MLKDRYLSAPIVEDLKNKMVFIGGPRQVGKTTLSETLIAHHYAKTVYLNWDQRQDRQKMMASEWPGDAKLIILDEVHKYKKWKQLIKGAYDTHKHHFSFIVTGSARLNLYRKGGDSLQGRYHYYVLHPFSLAELSNIYQKQTPFSELNFRSPLPELKTLNQFGGFPEPLLKQNERDLRRWHNERIDRLFKEDIRDTSNIKDIETMKLLGDLLPARSGSLLSINSLREDLEVSHRSVSNWLNILESFYYAFRIYPYTRSEIRSLKKESKLYLWDWSEISEEGPRFENLIASHLLKFSDYLHDREGYKTKLYFLRDLSKREVDFILTIDGKPWFAVEAKTQDKTPSPHLKYFKNQFKIPFSYQVIQKTGTDVFKDDIRVISADKFLSALA